MYKIVFFAFTLFFNLIVFQVAICEIHKREHDFERLSKQFTSIQDSCITSSCALQYHLSILAVSIQSWGTETWLWNVPRSLVQKMPDLSLIFSLHIFYLSRHFYFLLSEVHRFFLCVLCLPWYSSSYHAYSFSSWTCSFKDGKLNLQTCEIHLPWCFLWSGVHQILQDKQDCNQIFMLMNLFVFLLQEFAEWTYSQLQLLIQKCWPYSSVQHTF